jgi:hypothetical protein
MSSVFLSHNSKDKPWVRMLSEKLTVDGVVVWLDEAEINIGDSLIEKISVGIQDMKFVAAVISKNSLSSSWVQKEISIAMSREVSGRKVTVLPLLIEKCELPASLSDKLYADFTDPDNFESEYLKLLKAIEIHKEPKSLNTKSIVRNPTLHEYQTVISSEGKTDNELDIRIIGVVKERTRQDRQYSGLQDYYLQLSEKPPQGWENFFKRSRHFPRHSMWREAWIEGDCVVVKCAIDELGCYHVNDLKQDISTANKNYVEAKSTAERKRKLEIEREKAERLKRDQLLENLDFS